MNKAPRLPELLNQGFFAAPGVMDAFTARIVESLGFSAIYLGGNSLGLHLCAGQPLVTLTETIDSARQILAAIEVPLIVDAGAGFGEPAHTHRAVRELERAGIAAIHIDDQPYPKRAAYHLGRGGLAPLPEVVDKLRVGVAAKRTKDFLIFARTDALKVTGSLEQTIERCVAYVEAGVDGLVVLNLAPEQVVQIKRAVPRTPLAWFTSPTTLAPTTAELAAAGFALALYPFNTAGAVAEAVLNTWSQFKEKGQPVQPPSQLGATAKMVQDIIGMKTYWDIESDVSRE